MSVLRRRRDGTRIFIAATTHGSQVAVLHSMPLAGCRSHCRFACIRGCLERRSFRAGGEPSTDNDTVARKTATCLRVRFLRHDAESQGVGHVLSMGEVWFGLHKLRKLRIRMVSAVAGPIV